MFYDKLQAVCKQRGTTVTAVVVALGMSRGAMGGWKKGQTPRYSTLKKLADYLDVSINDLLDDEQKEKPADDGGLVNSDIDLTEYLERLAKRPELRMLFSVTKDATKADVEKAVRIIEALRNEEQKK